MTAATPTTATDPTRIEVRRLSDHDDHQHVGRLVRAAYDALPEMPEEPEYLDYLADVRARRHEADVIVALVDGRVLGCLTFVPGPGTHHHEFADQDATSFRYFGVDPAAQGSGVGRAMVQWCIDETRRIGKPRLRIHTLTAMDAAQRLYLRMGFVRTPEFDENWDGVEGIAYVYELTG
jgi:GNAT superfamily N-acetyltransferase